MWLNRENKVTGSGITLEASSKIVSFNPTIGNHNVKKVISGRTS